MYLGFKIKIKLNKIYIYFLKNFKDVFCKELVKNYLKQYKDILED